MVARVVACERPSSGIGSALPRRLPRAHRLTFGSGSPSVAIVAGVHGNKLNSIPRREPPGLSLRVQRSKEDRPPLPDGETFGADEGASAGRSTTRTSTRAFPATRQALPFKRIAHALLEASGRRRVRRRALGARRRSRDPQVRVPMSGEGARAGPRDGAARGVAAPRRRDGCDRPRRCVARRGSRSAPTSSADAA